MNKIIKIFFVLAFIAIFMNIFTLSVQAVEIKDDASTTVIAKKTTLGDITSGADTFLNAGGEQTTIGEDDLKDLSDTVYNILFTLGIIIIVIVGIALGIKFMTSGLEGKAETKAMLLPYIIGCVIILGSFGIWKIVVLILQKTT